jgi:uncharacterized protein DUF3311
MAQSNPPGRSPAAWAAATIVLLIAVAATLVVPIYARTTPKLGDFPFFYWYQLILVPVVAILAWICYLLLRTRPAPGSGPASTGGTPE